MTHNVTLRPRLLVPLVSPDYYREIDTLLNWFKEKAFVRWIDELNVLLDLKFVGEANMAE